MFFSLIFFVFFSAAPAVATDDNSTQSLAASIAQSRLHTTIHTRLRASSAAGPSSARGSGKGINCDRYLCECMHVFFCQHCLVNSTHIRTYRVCARQGVSKGINKQDMGVCRCLLPSFRNHVTCRKNKNKNKKQK